MNYSLKNKMNINQIIHVDEADILNNNNCNKIIPESANIEALLELVKYNTLTKAQERDQIS